MNKTLSTELYQIEVHDNFCRWMFLIYERLILLCRVVRLWEIYFWSISSFLQSHYVCCMICWSICWVRGLYRLFSFTLSSTINYAAVLTSRVMCLACLPVCLFVCFVWSSNAKLNGRKGKKGCERFSRPRSPICPNFQFSVRDAQL